MSDLFRQLTRRETLALTGAAALAGCSGTTPRTGTSSREKPPQENQQAADAQQRDTVRAFVGSYHWGYFVLDENGDEREQLSLSPGDELRLTLFNVEATDAVQALPRAVRRNVPSSAERAQRNEQAIPVPRGTSLETLHEAAEAAYPDHSLVVLDDDSLGGGPNGPGEGPGSGGPPGSWGGYHGPHGGAYGPGQGGRGPGQGPGSSTGPWMMPGSGPGMHGPGWGGGFAGLLTPPVYLWHHATVPNELGFVVNTTGSFGFACTVYCGYGHPYMAERSRVVVTDD